MAFSQWTYSPEYNAYFPTRETVPVLPPGYYNLGTDSANRLYFAPVTARDDTLLQFPDSVAGEVVKGINDFWSREEAFRKYGLPFKRGILLHGPAGMGKTSTLQLIAREVVSQGGVVMPFHVSLFERGYRLLRDIQPGMPLVVFIEDIEMYEASEGYKDAASFLNILDGAESISRTVFLATTNHPEKLSARIINRPSRFDMIIEVLHPDKEMRRLYLASLASHDEIEVDRYVQDTEGMSFANIKELFIATMILGNSYEESLARLKAMSLSPYRPSDQPSANGLQKTGQYL